MFIPVPGTIVYGSGNALTTTISMLSLLLTTLMDVDDPLKCSNPVLWQQYLSKLIATAWHKFTTSSVIQGCASSYANLIQKRVSTISETFDADAVSGSRSASLVIVSGDNQRSDADTHDVDDPLVVRVRRPGGYRISNVIIRFTALIGALEAAPGPKYVLTTDATALPSARGGYTPTGVIADHNEAIKGSVSGQEIFVLTDAHGEAAVVYNKVKSQGRRRLRRGLTMKRLRRSMISRFDRWNSLLTAAEANSSSNSSNSSNRMIRQMM